MALVQIHICQSSWMLNVVEIPSLLLVSSGFLGRSLCAVKPFHHYLHNVLVLFWDDVYLASPISAHQHDVFWGHIWAVGRGLVQTPWKHVQAPAKSNFGGTCSNIWPGDDKHSGICVHTYFKSSRLRRYHFCLINNSLLPFQVELVKEWYSLQVKNKPHNDLNDSAFILGYVLTYLLYDHIFTLWILYIYLIKLICSIEYKRRQPAM
jgi:hypothetical protein